MAENPTWGAPRIHGELLMLSFDVSERTISRWMKRTQRNPNPAKRWITFLRNHKEARRPLNTACMRILLDECVNQRMRNYLPGRECQSARYAGFGGLKNGEPLNAAEAAGFDVLVTVDRGFRYE